MSPVAVLGGLEARRLSRRAWLQVAAAAGLALVVVIALVAASHEGMAREDSLRRGAAALLLLGGLAVAVTLGSPALNRGAETGHFGLLCGAGASRAQLVTAVVGARVAVLAAILAAWGVGLQLASAAVGLGLDGPLAVHALAVAVGLLLAMLAAAAAGAIVGPLAAGAFGLMVYVLAQAVVNLEAAAEQGLIGTAADGVRFLYYISPRAITSPMIADLQARDAGGAAAPQVEVNGNPVLLGASGWGSILWTLAWCLLFAALCGSGLRRRPFR